jgi:uncharacterized membrane protein (DUF485 family)
VSTVHTSRTGATPYEEVQASEEFVELRSRFRRFVFGLLQFVSTFSMTMWYRRWADREFDPTADALRERIEGGEVR